MYVQVLASCTFAKVKIVSLGIVQLYWTTVLCAIAVLHTHRLLDSFEHLWCFEIKMCSLVVSCFLDTNFLGVHWVTVRCILGPALRDARSYLLCTTL